MKCYSAESTTACADDFSSAVICDWSSCLLIWRRNRTFQNALCLMQLSLWRSLEATEVFLVAEELALCSDLYLDLDLLAEKSSVSNSSAASVDSGQSGLHVVHSAKHTRLPYHNYASTGKHPATEERWSGKQARWASRSPVICWFCTYFE